MWLAAALGTAICFGVNNTLFKWGTTRGLSKVSIQFYFYLIAFLCLTIFGVVDGTWQWSIPALILGGTAGILNANGNIQMSKAFERGPAGITSALIASNAIIPILASSMFFPDAITPMQWLGILLMISASIVIQYKPGAGKDVNYKSWLVHILLALVSLGLVAFLLKVASFHDIGFLALLSSFYLVGLVYLAGFSFLRGETIRLAELKVGGVVGLLSITGFFSYLFALEKGPASIIFPIISLNCLVVMMAGLILFKEKLQTYQVVALFVALAGLVMVRV